MNPTNFFRDLSSLTQPKRLPNFQKSDLGNLSTSRIKNDSVRQFNIEENMPDSQRSYRSNISKDAFVKLQNLQFQNDLFQLQMQVFNCIQMCRSHINKRKNYEEIAVSNQLKQLQNDIKSIHYKIANTKKIQKNKKQIAVDISYDSEKSSENSSMSSEYSLIHIMPQSLQQKKPQNMQLNMGIMSKYQQLFNVCKLHDKLQTLFNMHCSSLKTIELDIINNNYGSLLDNVLRMLIELIEKFNQIKIDNIYYKEVTPDKGGINFEFETFNKKGLNSKNQDDSLSPVFNSRDDLSEMRMKLSDQYERLDFDRNQRESQTQTDFGQRQKMIPKITSPLSATNQNNSQQTLDKSIKSQQPRSKKHRIDLMPSLKQRKVVS